MSDEEVDEDKNKSEENNIKQKKKPKLKNSEGYITLKKGNTIENNSDENNLIQNLQELDIDDMSSNLENNKKEKTALIKKNKKENNKNKYKDNSKEISSSDEKYEEYNTVLYSYIDEDNNIKLYSVKKYIKGKEEIFLTCKDRNCKGTGKYNIESAKITIINECSLLYHEHNYVKEKISIDKIKSGEATSYDMTKDIYQAAYFNYMKDLHPSLSYDNILLELIDKYKVKEIKYSKKQFVNSQNRKKEKINLELYNEERLSNIKLYDSFLQNIYFKYYDENTKNMESIRIYGTNESLKLLSSSKISQYFIDGTYKCLPINQKEAKVLILLIGFNTERNMFELCCCSVFSKEDTDIYVKFYQILKTNFSFEPKKITMDFALANINAITNVFKDEEVIILTCLFHLLQTWWRKAIKLGLKKKNI